MVMQFGYRIGQGGRIDRARFDTERWPDGWTDTPDKLAAPPAEETVAHKMPTETGEVYGERRKGGWPKGVSRSDMAKR